MDRDSVVNAQTRLCCRDKKKRKESQQNALAATNIRESHTLLVCYVTTINTLRQLILEQQSRSTSAIIDCS